VAEHDGWAVLFVCDGCTDGTPEKLLELIAADSPAIRAEVYTNNRGKGYALRRGFDIANTPYLIFTDVDLAYDPDEAVKLLKVLQDGYDLAVVNRAHPDSRFAVSPRDFPSIYKRHVMSRTFNWFLRRVLPITILDTQAGLKGITAQAWARLSPQLGSNGFFFDVELLALAGIAGLRTGETPVNFSYHDPTTVRMVRHGWVMLNDTFRLRRSRKKRVQERESAILRTSADSTSATIPKPEPLRTS
jgi:glycosyltransferase involved in cell wall biosynthesis